MKRALAFALLMALCVPAQVYSPKVLKKGQPDASDLHKLAEGIYAQAGAKTPRERAEAVWRFFLTDGRFVKPGFWYHIAGWAYEEPEGEVLDPLKMLNSYGFGLCYQIAPVLEAVWKAGGFDARVWFLTGHTVAEVFYDGAYHYYDSDMMGYNTVGRGDVRRLPVASVHQIEQDGGIILSQPGGSKPDPWYPADVRANAIGGLADLFTTKSDNWLFPFERAPQGHSMEFVLRPGERLIRYFEPQDGAFYLPYQSNASEWREFPQEIAQYQIQTADGPRSQKDSRRWATGRLEYRPRLTGEARSVFDVSSPYVILDAEFVLDAQLTTADETLAVETSLDGRTWTPAGDLRGPYRGSWKVQPAVLTQSEHGRRTAVSGAYGYLVRVTKSPGTELRDLSLATRIQLNPRTLPELSAGHNELEFSAGPRRIRRVVYPEPVVSNARYVSENGQGFWIPASDGPADLTFRLTAESLDGFDAGGRFLDLSSGLAPDKFTAEVRKTAPVAAKRPAASIAWSTSPNGPFEPVWEYNPKLKWKDGIPIDRVLLWPEVDRHVAVEGPRDVYVRYRFQDLALDHFRLATFVKATGSSPLEVTHVWKENGVERTASRQVSAAAAPLRYTIDTAPGAKIVNESIIFEAR
jgi:hypothetical protein